MNNISDIFDDLLMSCGSVDIAESEFKRMIASDSDLHSEYRDWCLDNGHTERHGFLDYAEEYLQRQDSVWDSLADYDNFEN